MNWRAYLRLDKLFLKMFQVEPRVPVRILLDLSDSMLAHGGQKMAYARQLTAVLCYVGLVRQDSIEVLGFHESADSAPACPAGGGRHAFSPVMEALSLMEARGRTDYLAMVSSSSPRTRSAAW